MNDSEKLNFILIVMPIMILLVLFLMYYLHTCNNDYFEPYKTLTEDPQTGIDETSGGLNMELMPNKMFSPSWYRKLKQQPKRVNVYAQYN